MTFSEFADYVTVMSGCMTIFGLGGLFTWGIFGRDRGGLSTTVFKVFAYSIKTGICLLLFVPFLLIWHLLYMNLILVVVGSFSHINYYWSSEDAFQYLFVYMATVVVLLPIYCLSCLSVYQWSLAPFITFYKALRHRSEDTTIR